MKEILLVFISFISIILFICILYNNKKNKKRLKELEEFYINKGSEQFKNQILLKNKNLLEEQNKIQDKINKITIELNEKQNFNSSLVKIRDEELNRLFEEKRDKIDQMLKSHKQLQSERIQREIDEWQASAQSVATQNYLDTENEYEQLLKNIKIEISEYMEDLNNYKEKRDAINKEILRQRAIEEQLDFYRIQIDEDSKFDIEIMKEIKTKLSKIELFNKFIYDNYIARPSKDMVKRVLEGRNPCGIYKITNIDTKEIYIGKSVKIADRWIKHIKSACGLEGVADSQFQRALKKYGVDNFTWEILEEVEKDKLTEREKYYISFYGTKEYGYNLREG